MANVKKIREIINEANSLAIFIEGFDNALVGTGQTVGGKIVAVYDAGECISILIEEHNMEEFEALDHFKAIVNNDAYGTNKPIFINDWTKAVNAEDILKNNIDKNKNVADLIS